MCKIINNNEFYSGINKKKRNSKPRGFRFK